MIENIIKTHICIIGAGAGGLTIASVASQLGLDVVLIEKANMGGDCLNTGCVPSKALLAAAKRAENFRKDNIKGIKALEPEIDFAQVKEHVFDTIKSIEPHDSQERFESLGVNVIREFGKFISENRVQAGDKIITAKYFIVATGSSAVQPTIKGLDNDNERVFTNETIFELRERPQHLVIIGGGPIGVEMAQAHRRLGCKVTMVFKGSLLQKDEPLCVNILRRKLKKEGIEFYEDASINEVEHNASGLIVKGEFEGNDISIEGTHLLVAAGRKVNIEGLDLEKAGVDFDRRGIKTDSRMRSNVKNIFAVGDVSGGPQFTHVAGYQAGIIIRNICFKMPAKVSYKALPWVTYTDPEIAQVGMTESMARKEHGNNIKITEYNFGDNDRARAENERDGLIRLITKKNGLILGVSMVGLHAGELIAEWALAISNNMKVGAVAGTMIAYPTLSEMNQRAAGAWYTESLFSAKTKFIVKLLQKLPF